MSRPRFMVFKLNDLKFPAFLVLIVIAAFSIFLLSDDNEQSAFAPATSYEDGMYVANLAFTDANLDVVVNVADNQITSITLDGFDEYERTLYSDLDDSISFVNDYVTSTQSLELPEGSHITVSTSILMDALAVALSEDSNASMITTYQVPVLEELIPTTQNQNLSDLPVDDSLLEEKLNEEDVEVFSDEESAVPTDSAE